MSTIARTAGTSLADKRTFYQRLGRRVSLVRDQNGYSQPELARAVGVSKSTISVVEDGQNCSALLLALLAEELGVLVDELIPLDATPKITRTKEVKAQRNRPSEASGLVPIRAAGGSKRDDHKAPADRQKSASLSGAP